MLDYHLHLWPHGQRDTAPTLDQVAAYCERAQAAGVTEIALTEHLFRFRQADHLLRGFWDDDPDAALRASMADYWDSHAHADLDAYVSCVLAAQAAGLPVVLGLEVDYYRGRMGDVAELLAGYPFDVLLGSVHWVGTWRFDDLDDPVSRDQWSVRAVDRAWSDYVTAIEELAQSGTCDVLAHPDLVKVAGYRPAAPDECYDRLVEAAVSSGMAAELSSAGWRKPVAEAYPSPSLLARFVGAGVPLTTASDAHRLADVADRSADLATMLDALEVGTLRSYRHRRARDVPWRPGGAVVMTPAELAAAFTDLDEADFDHLQRLLGSWGVLSDLSFSDLLLLVPARGSDGQSLLVLGQIRPTTSVTLLRVDLVGQVVPAEDWEVAAEAVRTGKVVSGVANVPAPTPLPAPLLPWPMHGDTSDTGEVPAVPDTAQFECVPVPLGGAAPAVMVRIGPLEDRRRSYRLERVYRDLYQRLAAMVAAGDYPFAGEDVTTEDAPRVGDGLILVDTEGRIVYSSPNAMSALHRMGVTDAVEGRRLPDLGVEETAVDRALAAGCPVIEEVERRPDVIVLVHCTPLLVAGTVTGAMVLLRDVTDLRRLDRLLLSKDAAIREVHHRVKNNLQTISSLLRLQARRLAPGQGQEALREAERRVRSIAVVHEILSREPGDEVPFDEIVTSLVRMAEDSAVSGHRVDIQVTGDIGEVGADVATPLAVVLAELLQNAVEHAFPSNGADDSDTDDADVSEAAPVGRVDLVLANHGRRLTLQVRDDGLGLPPGFDIEETTSLGLSIVRDLVLTQLEGTIVMESRGGTLVTLDIPVPGVDEGASWR